MQSWTEKVFGFALKGTNHVTSSKLGGREFHNVGLNIQNAGPVWIVVHVPGTLVCLWSRPMGSGWPSLQWAVVGHHCNGQWLAIIAMGSGWPSLQWAVVGQCCNRYWLAIVAVGSGWPVLQWALVNQCWFGVFEWKVQTGVLWCVINLQWEIKETGSLPIICWVITNCVVGTVLKAVLSAQVWASARRLESLTVWVLHVWCGQHHTSYILLNFPI